MGKIKKLICYIDGDSLCIVKKDFINLQESPAIFIKLSKRDLKEIVEIDKIRNKI